MYHAGDVFPTHMMALGVRSTWASEQLGERTTWARVPCKKLGRERNLGESSITRQYVGSDLLGLSGHLIGSSQNLKI